MITGTALRGEYPNSSPSNDTGKLTGLIGEEGAVGAFLIDSDTAHNDFGAFVARPSSAAELATLEKTCADNPFHEHCNIGYESERHAIIEYCIIGGNANDTKRCGSANARNYCVSTPFRTECRYNFTDYYKQARANRLAFLSDGGKFG